MTALIVTLVLIATPVCAFVAWPFVRRRADHQGLLAIPSDPLDQLLAEKERLYRTLEELDFERDAGHLSADDHGSLRDRYERRAVEVIAAMDELATRTVDARPAPRPTPASAPAWTRRPVTIALGAASLLGFGIALGLGLARHTKPDMAASAPPPAPPPLSDSAAGAPSAANAPRGPLTPQMLQGMLQAARSSLQAGRYSEAIAAYQAVLKRDPKNVDALAHLGLIVAIGGHADAAIETLDRALRIDPNYPAALLYRGQVLFEMKRDYAGATTTWEKFLAVVPVGEEHDRVAALVREAQQRSATP